jgi:hypothetical protein
VLEIGVFDKDSGRNQKIQVENADLIYAQFVRDIHLKMKKFIMIKVLLISSHTISLQRILPKQKG